MQPEAVQGIVEISTQGVSIFLINISIKQKLIAFIAMKLHRNINTRLLYIIAVWVYFYL